MMSIVPSQLFPPAPDFAPGQLLTTLLILSLLFFALALVHASLALVYRRRNELHEAREHALQERWKPAVIAHVLGEQDRDAVDLVVAPSRALLFLGFLVPFNRRLAGEERRAARRLAAPYLPAAAKLIKSRRAETRARALQTVAELGEAQYEQELLAGLDDPSPLVAMLAARLLCQEERASHVPRVIERLHRFRSWSPRFLSSMLASAGPSVAPALLDKLRDRTSDPHVRAVAAGALGLLQHFPAGDAAAQAVADDTDSELTAAALRLLALVGRASHLDLVRASLSDPRFHVRLAASDALAALGGHPDLERLQDLVYDDPSRWVAIHAARGLLGAGRLEFLRALAHSVHPRGSIAAQVLVEGGR